MVPLAQSSPLARARQLILGCIQSPSMPTPKHDYCIDSARSLHRRTHRAIMRRDAAWMVLMSSVGIRFYDVRAAVTVARAESYRSVNRRRLKLCYSLACST